MPRLTLFDSVSKTVGLIASVLGIISVFLALAGGYLHILPTPIPSPPFTMTTSNGNTTFTSDSGFRINFPTNLSYKTAMNSSENPKIMLFFAPWHFENLSFQTDDSYKGAHVTLQDVAADYDRNARLAAADGKDTTNDSVRLGGEPAYKIEYGQEVLLEAHENHTVLVMEEFSLHNNKVYSVRYSAMPIVYWYYLPKVQQIIDSFEYT